MLINDKTRNTRRHFERHFNSMYEYICFVRDVNDAGTYGDTNHGYASLDEPHESWCMNTTLDEAINMGLNGGWAEGAKKLLKINIKKDISSEIPLPSLEHGVIGACPDIGAYCAGDPENMHVMALAPVSRPFIRLIVDVGIMSGVTSKSAMIKGRCILSIADALMRKGYLVQIDALVKCEGYTETYIRVKEPSEPWNPAVFAFVFGHPAFHRRINFRFREWDKKSVYATFARGYGSSVCDIDTKGMPNTAYIPGLHDNIRSTDRYLSRVAWEISEQVDNSDVQQTINQSIAV